jgi:putative ABC transport system permease protein
MTPLISLAARSAWNRRFVLSLTVASIALSTFLLLGLERLRSDVRESFSQSVSGTDLVVGARTGGVQLMLYAVFRIGNATANLRMTSVEEIAQHKAVAWTVPISLGDSHRGYSVVGTTLGYFEHFRHGDQQPLGFSAGRAFAPMPAGLFEAVVGAEVAERLGYRPGARITLSHGDGSLAANDHADKPFTVVGVLARTGTPVDRSVHISLESMEAIHIDWFAGAPMPGMRVTAEQAAQQDLRPKAVTAVLVGLKNRAAVFSVQRFVNEFRAEPLVAVLPGVALDELWDVVGAGEQALRAASALVAVVSLAGLVAVIAAGLNERRRELAILRAVGAAPRQVLWLLMLEGSLATAAGVLIGALLHVAALAGTSGWVQGHYGITLRLGVPDAAQWAVVAAVLVAGVLASLVPAWRAYRLSLADGLSPPV